MTSKITYCGKLLSHVYLQIPYDPFRSDYKLIIFPAPLLNLFDIPLSTRQMNNTFLDSESSDIYRQPLSEVDLAWDKLPTLNPIPITQADVIALRKDPARAAKFPESFGFEPNAYVGKLEVFHQIHCLNSIRKNLHSNYAYYSNDKPPDAFHDLHVNHCIGALLQEMMCSANVDVYTYMWVDALENAMPDFRINHKCQDIDAIIDWHEEHGVPLEKWASVRKSPDYETLIMTHEFKELVGWFENHLDNGSSDGEIVT